MATKKWFVVAGDNELGPLGPRGLRKLVRSGEVRPETKIRREDQSVAVRADNVRGLFGGGESHAAPQPQLHGPFTSLRPSGWFIAALLAAWVAVGVLGAFTAWSQREVALQIAGGADRPLLEAGAPFLGLGGVVAGVLFFATGVGFVYWLWNARVNLPHLIHARMRLAPSWTIAAWFVPILNLVRPYEVLVEIDRLSTEAAADGDATRDAERRLLLPWWISTQVLIALAITYKLLPVADAEQIAFAALVHLGASAAVAFAGAFGAGVVLHVTLMQERAHDRHPEPVRLHHEVRRNPHGAASA